MFWCIAVLTNSSEGVVFYRGLREVPERHPYFLAGPWSLCMCVCVFVWDVFLLMRLLLLVGCVRERVRGCQRCRVYSYTRCELRPTSRRPSECASDPGSSAASPASAAAVETREQREAERCNPCATSTHALLSHHRSGWQIHTRHSDQCVASGSCDLCWEDRIPSCAPSPSYI